MGLWTAKECLEGSIDRYGEAQDVYAFSILCVECVTEMHPYYRLLDSIRDTFKCSAKQAMDHLLDRIIDDQARPALFGPEGRCSPSEDFTKLIEDCWQEQASARPSAHVLHLRLAAIVEAHKLGEFDEASKLQKFKSAATVLPSIWSDGGSKDLVVDDELGELYGEALQLSFRSGSSDDSWSVVLAKPDGSAERSIPLAWIRSAGRWFSEDSSQQMEQELGLIVYSLGDGVGAPLTSLRISINTGGNLERMLLLMMAFKG